jgi:two-component system sensor histidine kinase HydH
VPVRADVVLAEILADVRLDKADRVRLRDAYDVIAPEIPAITANLEHWMQSPGGATAVAPSLRDTLARWMTSGLLGPYDASFYDQRVWIGRRHLDLGLPQHYIVLAVGVIRASYADRLALVYDRASAHEAMSSIDKLLSLELALVLRQYQLDSEAKLVDRERQSQRERVVALQTLSAGFAHEIRNPINAALLQLELVHRRIKRESSDERLVDPIERASEELDRLTRLLDEFLAFARPAELDLRDHDLVEIVRELVIRERAATGANIDIVSDGPVFARVDAVKLRQAIQNLLSNSLEAITRGGHIVVTTRGDDTFARVCIADDGPGIPDHVRARIFEPFFTTKDSGTGLGMSIVHSIVTQHGGSIEIDSRPGSTRCELVVPRQRSLRTSSSSSV